MPALRPTPVVLRVVRGELLDLLASEGQADAQVCDSPIGAQADTPPGPHAFPRAGAESVAHAIALVAPVSASFDQR